MQSQRADLHASGMSLPVIAKLELQEFAAAIKKARRGEKTDKKTDTLKNIPPKEVVEVARYIRAHWALVEQGKAPKKFKKTLIKEAVGEANWESMERQLNRFPGILTLPDRPDK